MNEKNDRFKKLIDLKINCYAPYSKFCVTCIITLKDGNEFFGVNVENSSYPATICAERSALASLISQGFKSENILTFSLYTDSNGFGTMCGICRQVMSEHIDKNLQIEIFNKNGFCFQEKFEKFLPFAFEKDMLKK